MRVFQEYGLSPEAEQWLVDNCKVEQHDPCPHCGEFTKTNLKVVATQHEDHCYGGGPQFQTYVTKGSGFLVREVTDCQFYDGGPCHFKCLQLEDGSRVGEWKAELINHMLGGIFVEETDGSVGKE